jgi:stage V sporulation protein SpoVS/hydrogenase maturation factor
MAIGLKEQTASSVPTPAAGEQYTFLDSSDSKFKRKDSTGNVTPIESLAGSVNSVFGRGGDVVAADGDYSADQIAFTPSGDLTATRVDDALVELDNEKAPITHVGLGGVGAHPVADGTTAGFLSPSDFTKIQSVESGATQNSSDAYLLSRANHTGTQTAATISDFSSAADARIAIQKAAANGLATLDGSSKIPIAQLPTSVVGAVTYISAWNASINSPPLASGVGTKGYYYVVSVAGSTSLDTISDWKVGDWVIFNGSAWEKIDNTDAVSSVNGYTGTVVLAKGDVGLGNVDNTSDLNKPISTATQTALNLKADSSAAISQLTGEVTAGPGGGSQAATLSNAAVINKVLTGFAETFGTVTAADTILQAIGKLAFSQNLHAQEINTSFTIPSGSTLISVQTRITGSTQVKISNGAIFKII